MHTVYLAYADQRLRGTDPDLATAEIYANGELIGTNEIEEPRPLSIGTADIGNWPYQEWAEGTEFQVRNLDGAIDEFLVMQRALKPSEIGQIFAAGRP